MWEPEHPPFRPAWWWSNPHLQTLSAALRRGDFGSTTAESHQVTTDDDDRIVVHDNCPKKWITGDRVAIIVHGLCGSHLSPPVQRTAVKLRRQGVRTIRVDMRGWGASALVSRGHAYAGASGDLAAVVSAVRRWFPISKISLVGFSLGGNLLLKLLAEWGNEPPAAVDSAIAISPPIDLLRTACNLRHWGNRWYDGYFTRRLCAQLRWRRKHVPNLVDNGLQRLPKRLVHFDDQFTAPIHGFDGADDYYRKSGAASRLRDITVPTMLVAAEDDPLVPIGMYYEWPRSSRIELITTRRGGHLGFLGCGGCDPDPYWLEWRIAHWIANVNSQTASPTR